ncbi:hypothetical protein J5X84_31520 [Streptosporangiaceae bacterium NEAU-GS5]|nr:hypothetical protein [Streptosporangiaceae bacterium NEAU-GS5]
MRRHNDDENRNERLAKRWLLTGLLLVFTVIGCLIARDLTRMPNIGEYGDAFQVVTYVVSMFALLTSLLPVISAKDRRMNPPDGASAARADESPPSLTPPYALLPRAVVGHHVLRYLLKRLATLRFKRRRRVHVLAGIPGMGTTTLALDVARKLSRRHVWWICGADPDLFEAGMRHLAHTLPGSKRHLAEAGRGIRNLSDTVYEMLERCPRGWLLVIDDLAEPERAVKDGWLRPCKRGLTLVTSRHATADWGGGAVVHRIRELSHEQGAHILRKLAKRAGSPAEARALAGRLHGVPVALELAGRYLADPASQTHRFDDYRLRLEHDYDGALDSAAQVPGRASDVIRCAWRLAVDDLKARLPDAADLLQALACLGPQGLPSSLIPSEQVGRALRDAGFVRFEENPDHVVRVEPLHRDILLARLADDPENLCRAVARAAELLGGAVATRPDSALVAHAYALIFRGLTCPPSLPAALKTGEALASALGGDVAADLRRRIARASAVAPGALIRPDAQNPEPEARIPAHGSDPEQIRADLLALARAAFATPTAGYRDVIEDLWEHAPAEPAGLDAAWHTAYTRLQEVEARIAQASHQTTTFLPWHARVGLLALVLDEQAITAEIREGLDVVPPPVDDWFARLRLSSDPVELLAAAMWAGPVLARHDVSLWPIPSYAQPALRQTRFAQAILRLSPGTRLQWAIGLQLPAIGLLLPFSMHGSGVLYGSVAWAVMVTDEIVVDRVMRDGRMPTIRRLAAEMAVVIAAVAAAVVIGLITRSPLWGPLNLAIACAYVMWNYHRCIRRGREKATT